MVEIFLCSLGENPKGRKEKEEKGKKGEGNLGENPKGRQGRFLAASKHEKEQLMTWFIWIFSLFLSYLSQH